MQDEPTQGDLEREPDRTESLVIMLLLQAGHPWPWSVAELTRELGDELAATDAVLGLQAAGLLNRIGQFVFPTRSAARFEQLTRALG
jgi:hypothetical protein